MPEGDAVAVGCGTPIDMVHATVGKPNQRETWWCPRCQPAHRSARVDA